MSKHSVSSEGIEPKQFNQKQHEWKDEELYQEEEEQDDDLTCWEKFKKGAFNFYSRTIDYFQFDRIFELEGEKKIDLRRCQGRFLQNFDETYSERQLKFGYTFEDVLKDKQKEQERKEKRFCKELYRFICCQGGNQMIELDQLYRSERQYEILIRKKIVQERKDQYLEEMRAVKQEETMMEESSKENKELQEPQREHIMVNQNVFYNEGDGGQMQEYIASPVKQTVHINKKVKVQPIPPKDKMIITHEENHRKQTKIKKQQKISEGSSSQKEEENEPGKKNKIVKPKGTSSQILLKQPGNQATQQIRETTITRNIYHENHIYQDIIHENNIHHTTHTHVNEKMYSQENNMEKPPSPKKKKKKTEKSQQPQANNNAKQKWQDDGKIALDASASQNLIYSSPRPEGQIDPKLTFEVQNSPKHAKNQNDESSPRKKDEIINENKSNQKSPVRLDEAVAVKKRKARRQKKQKQIQDAQIVLDSPKEVNKNPKAAKATYSKTIQIGNRKEEVVEDETNDFNDPTGDVDVLGINQVESVKKKRKRKEKKETKGNEQLEIDNEIWGSVEGSGSNQTGSSSIQAQNSGLYKSTLSYSQQMEVKVEKKRKKNRAVKKIEEQVDQIIDLDLQ